VCHDALQCVAVCCSVLQWVEVCCNVCILLQRIETQMGGRASSRAALLHRKTRATLSLCVAVCCNVLQCVAVYGGASGRAISRMALVRGEKYVHVCCSVLQYVAVCCNVLQGIAVCCSVFRGVAAVLQCVAVYVWAQIQGR